MCPIGFYDFENHIYKTKTLFSSTSYNTANNQYAEKLSINEIGNTNINKRGITFTPTYTALQDVIHPWNKLCFRNNILIKYKKCY